jgi:aspartate carbamoyltransferase catalytic subunit
MNSKRDINSINDLENGEIEEIFALADEYCSSMGSPSMPHRIRGRRNDATDYILATLFYEPSTRTRFSFESAMLRLGGNVLASSDPTTTSVSKGESLADTVRVIQNYADIIVLRHPSEGAARAASQYVDIPIINGGDGSHEHPTQTLCDLYTLRREHKEIRGLNVLIVGDLKNGRTVHSLVYALARFGANIITMPGDGLELPEEVSNRLETEFYCCPMAENDIEKALGWHHQKVPVGAVYVASSQGQQLRLLGREHWNIGDMTQKFKRRIDVCYVTRPQRERFSEGQRSIGTYPIVDKEFLQGGQYKEARVLHPLPRVSELDYELDQDPRGVYFKQAGFGVPVRMALISKVVGIHPFRTTHTANISQGPIYEHRDGVFCANPRCITHNETEQRYLSQKARVVWRERLFLRCVYCETTTAVEYIGYKKTRTYVPSATVEKAADLSGVVMFRDEAAARAAGFERAAENCKHGAV